MTVTRKAYKHITNAQLKRMLRSYFGNNYKGEAIASDDLCRLAADRITMLEYDIKFLENCEKARIAQKRIPYV